MRLVELRVTCCGGRFPSLGSFRVRVSVGIRLLDVGSGLWSMGYMVTVTGTDTVTVMGADAVRDTLTCCLGYSDGYSCRHISAYASKRFKVGIVLGAGPPQTPIF